MKNHFRECLLQEIDGIGTNTMTGSNKIKQKLRKRAIIHCGSKETENGKSDEASHFGFLNSPFIFKLAKCISNSANDLRLYALI